MGMKGLLLLSVLSRKLSCGRWMFLAVSSCMGPAGAAGLPTLDRWTGIQYNVIIYFRRAFMSNMLNCTEQVQVQNIKHVHTRHPKQYVSKQSCSNIQLSSKDGLKKIKKKIIYILLVLVYIAEAATVAAVYTSISVRQHIKLSEQTLPWDTLTCLDARMHSMARIQKIWHSSPRQVNAGNKIPPSMHHPRRWNVTTDMVG